MSDARVGAEVVTGTTNRPPAARATPPQDAMPVRVAEGRLVIHTTSPDAESTATTNAADGSSEPATSYASEWMEKSPQVRSLAWYRPAM